MRLAGSDGRSACLIDEQVPGRCQRRVVMEPAEPAAAPGSHSVRDTNGADARRVQTWAPIHHSRRRRPIVAALTVPSRSDVLSAPVNLIFLDGTSQRATELRRIVPELRFELGSLPAGYGTSTPEPKQRARGPLE